jgi:hypothetical protein
MPEEYKQLVEQAQSILRENQRGDHTVPAGKMYPHQWLWDSCFIAIGLRHFDVERAQKELTSLVKGQWSNGMLPNMIINDNDYYATDKRIWQSWINPFAPIDVSTSGITQPPMLAEAVYLVGQKLTPKDRKKWYRKMYPALLRYHQWLYSDRDPHRQGLTIQLHPWETGLDNIAPWAHTLHSGNIPLWIRLISALNADRLVSRFRRDTHFVPIKERLTTIDGLAYFSAQRKLRVNGYNTERIILNSNLIIEDVAFNAILLKANQRLLEIAKYIKKQIPKNLEQANQKAITAFEELWDKHAEEYYPREFITHELVKIPSIESHLALYSGALTDKRVKTLVKNLRSENYFYNNYPVSTAPKDSTWFKRKRYWQGPTWINTNWLIIQGLKQAGKLAEAERLIQKTIELVQNNGFYEYYDPETGNGAGIKDFSWTAALIIDLVENLNRTN